ncbi:gliding motility-associated lipoprotein GldH [Saccharicrinis carchari]|uniref:Gliding motility-associated lipoprotein GldH n=1 Tax=Saccharicrinis carchari TaxID=1168039 RepID=A0A521EV46_SACCC|nr:gliding motility lipoprotein GldH [Saccharicrinis carchari]SMO86980.1 gliding motility-associated lipoprotein GldH [Saccharicrinis carchari]
MQKINLAIFCAFISLTGLLSCGPNMVYENTVPLPPTGWHKDTVAVFKSNVTDLNKSYHLLLEVENTDAYSYSNIWFFVDAISPSGHVQRDTVDCPLANDAGQWYGKNSWGSKVFSSMHPYKLNIRFPETGVYKYYVVQGMRDTVLSGVAGVGIKMMEVE